MIADFRFEVRPDPSCVAVRLAWAAGERIGLIEIPSELADEIADFDWPNFSLPMSVDGALSYAIFLSMRSDLPLRLTGDETVWLHRWGQIMKLN